MNRQTREDRDSILGFWFGEHPEDAIATAGAHKSLWWQKRPETDAAIRRRFEPLVHAVEAGKLMDWGDTPAGRLALILLLDQFTRNIYRDTPAAFRCDALAQDLCLAGLDAGADRLLLPIQRVFFYMPLEHAEDPALQNRCLDLFEKLLEEVAADERQLFAGFMDFARSHQVIIERFGRFPHRNAILGRESTAQEREFLRQPGSSF